MPCVDDVLSASTGGFSMALATVACYPLNFMIVQISLGKDESGTPYRGTIDIFLRTLKQGGPLALFRGLNFMLQYATLNMFSFFFLYSFTLRVYRQVMLRNSASKIRIGMNLVLGFIAACANTLTTLPFEVCVTRVQTGWKTKSRTLLAALNQVLREGGLRAAYTGVIPNLMLALNPALEFTIVDQVKTLLLAWQHQESLANGQAFILGGLAKCAATVITWPFIKAKLLLQASPGQDGRRLNFVGVVQKLCDGGLFGLLQGLHISLLKNMLKSALLLALKEYFDRLLTKYGRSLENDMSVTPNVLPEGMDSAIPEQRSGVQCSTIEAITEFTDDVLFFGAGADGSGMCATPKSVKRSKVLYRARTAPAVM